MEARVFQQLLQIAVAMAIAMAIAMARAMARARAGGRFILKLRRCRRPPKNSTFLHRGIAANVDVVGSFLGSS